MHQIVKLTWVAVLSGSRRVDSQLAFSHRILSPPAVEQIASPDSEDLVKQLRIQVESALAANRSGFRP